jgi:hypothetical protein
MKSSGWLAASPASALLHQFQDSICEMFQLVIAIYGYIMATGILCFILIFVVLFESLVNSENKPLPVKQHRVSFSSLFSPTFVARCH